MGKKGLKKNKEKNRGLGCDFCKEVHFFFNCFYIFFNFEVSLVIEI